jgi:hypothetical protein
MFEESPDSPLARATRPFRGAKCGHRCRLPRNQRRGLDSPSTCSLRGPRGDERLYQDRPPNTDRSLDLPKELGTWVPVVAHGSPSMASRVALLFFSRLLPLFTGPAPASRRVPQRGDKGDSSLLEPPDTSLRPPAGIRAALWMAFWRCFSRPLMTAFTHERRIVLFASLQFAPSARGSQAIDWPKICGAV